MVNRRESRFRFTGAVLASLLALLLLAPGCNSARPEAAAEQFYNLWAEQDYAAMYEFLDSASRGEYSEESFRERYGDISEGIGLLEVETAEVKKSGSSRQISLSLSAKLKSSFVGAIPLNYEMEWSRENWSAPWRLRWHPGLIFPELTGESKVFLDTVLPQRGAIFDRHGRMLAGPGPFKEVRALPGVYEDEESFIGETAALLDLSAEQIASKLRQPWVREGLYVPLALLAPSESKVINQLKQLEGIQIEDIEQRTYPEAAVAAHLTGYLGEITAEELEEKEKEGYCEGELVGKYGLEAALEEKLAGSKGYTLHIVDEAGKEVAIIAEKAAEKGEDVKLTIDLKLQRCAARALGKKPGAVAALDPRSGEVLVLYSSPGFDPNSFIAGFTPTAWQELQEDEAQPFLNRALSGTYPPGSAIKPFTAAAALDSRALSAEEKVAIKGKRWQPSESWGDYYVRRVSSKARQLDLDKAMKLSDNIYFARAGLALGRKKFTQYGECFGLGEELPLPLPAARSRLSKEGIKSEIQLADSSFGQGEVLITPLQMALTYCPFAGEGSIPRPQLELPVEPALWKEEVVSPAVAKRVHRALVGAVHSPGAPSAAGAVKGFEVAGKTGTAEIDDGEGNICWYVTYGPAQSPQLVVAVVMEGAGWASSDALPVGRAVLERWLLQH